MTVPDNWLAEAFFDDPELDSLDGGTTDQGPLWHAISPRWGHSMHSMCSYHGMFPPRLAHYFIQRYSKPGDLVVDPFSGRGTTTLQARVEGRRTLGNDLSPLAYVLTAAKANPPAWTSINTLVKDLEGSFRKRAQRDFDVADEIRMLYHDNTLSQLVFLRNYLLRAPFTEWSPEELMLAGAVAGILHGAQRSDGSSMYLSISMPNTFSMPPEYVRKFIQEKSLVKIDQNVFERLRDKLARIYLDSNIGLVGRAYHEDASQLLMSSAIRPGTVSLVLTSPPYLRVVNYGTSNWIRLWWLGIENVSRHGGAGRKTLDAALDHRHTYDSYRAFMLRTLKSVQRGLRPDGVAIFVVGDVSAPNGQSDDLARHLWDDVGEDTGLRLLDLVEDSLPAQNKVSRIWGDTKGRATDQDGDPVAKSTEIEWDEAYKDGGPDEAHARYRLPRLAS
jgi:site-specific DNA-methyltransferase (adenine-specific)